MAHTCKTQGWSCSPRSVPSIEVAAASSGEEPGILQRCWVRNNPSRRPLPVHSPQRVFSHVSAHLGTGA